MGNCQRRYVPPSNQCFIDDSYDPELAGPSNVVVKSRSSRGGNGYSSSTPLKFPSQSPPEVSSGAPRWKPHNAQHNASTIAVQVSSIGGDIIAQFEALGSLTVGSVRERLRIITGIPMTEQRLAFEEHVLENDAACLSEIAAGALLSRGMKVLLQITLIQMRRQLALSGSYDHTLRLWDLHRGQCVRELRGHSCPVVCVSIDWSARRALSGGRDHSLRLWDLEMGECVWQVCRGDCMLDTPFAVPMPRNLLVCVSLDWTSHRALSASHDHVLQIWDLRQNEPVQELRGEDTSLWFVTVDWPSNRAMSGSHEFSVLVWDILNGAVTSELKGHSQWVSCVVADWSGNLALTGSSDRTLKVWNIKTGASILELSGHAGPIGALAVDWSASRALSGDNSWTVRLWDLSSGETVWVLRGHTRPVGYVSMDWTSRRGASGSLFGTICFWDLERGTCLQELRGCSFDVNCISVDWVSKRAITSGEDKILRMWDIVNGTEESHMGGHMGGVGCIGVQWG